MTVRANTVRDENQKRGGNTVNSANAKMSQQYLSRSEYEDECRSRGTEAHSDERIRECSYSIKYGDTAMPLELARQRTLERESKILPRPFSRERLLENAKSGWYGKPALDELESQCRYEPSEGDSPALIEEIQALFAERAEVVNRNLEIIAEARTMLAPPERTQAVHEYHDEWRDRADSFDDDDGGNWM